MAPIFGVISFLLAVQLGNAGLVSRNTPSCGPVYTTSGPVTGHQSPLQPGVSEYLGIPFAKPPVGNLRWGAPQGFWGNSPINATQFKPDCPATLPLPGYVGPSSSEDCLYLNVWAPTSNKPKATMIWIYGGDWVSGSTALPSTNGANLAAEQDVIVVSINYRVGIFGFPGAPGLPSQNLGLLDQRLAIEWIQENIEAFGGSPGNMVLFGQSAGAASIDIYSFAYLSNPIVQGFIGESGSATMCGLLGNQSFVSWANVSTQLGCGTGPASVSCMMQKTEAEIMDVAVTIQANWVPAFTPSVDNEIVFSDYQTRGAQGNFIKKPFLIGNNNHESGPGLDLLADAEFDCPVSEIALDRVNAGVNAWRYRYFGGAPYNVTNQETIFAQYHGAEIIYVFGNVPNATAIETQVSQYMMTAWAAFAKNPQSGLKQLGWPVYNPNGNTLVQLYYENQTTASFAPSLSYDGNCPTLTCAEVLNITVVLP